MTHTLFNKVHAEKKHSKRFPNNIVDAYGKTVTVFDEYVRDNFVAIKRQKWLSIVFLCYRIRHLPKCYDIVNAHVIWCGAFCIYRVATASCINRAELVAIEEVFGSLWSKVSDLWQCSQTRNCRGRTSTVKIACRSLLRMTRRSRKGKRESSAPFSKCSPRFSR